MNRQGRLALIQPTLSMCRYEDDACSAQASLVPYIDKDYATSFSGVIASTLSAANGLVLSDGVCSSRRDRGNEGVDDVDLDSSLFQN